MNSQQSFQFFDNSRFYEKFKKISCTIPFTSFHITRDGNVANCCYYWMPNYVGNILDQTLLQIIDSATAKNMKDSVLDGTFKYCNAEVCPSLIEYAHINKLDYPLIEKEELKKFDLKKIVLFMDYDLSCNLFCESCRNQRILHALDDAPEILKKIHSRLMEQVIELQNAGYQLIIHVTGSGDGFASPFFWNFLKNVKHEDNYVIRLTTNGTLMTRERLSHPFGQKIDHIEISIDAASEPTYAKVRRGGNFTALKKNLINLDEMIENKELPNLKFWKMNFVVQADNYQEMVDFANWALSFKHVEKIWYMIIYDWGHLTKESFESKAIWMQSHPDHHKLLEVLKDPIFSHPKIIIGNLGELRNKALAKAEAVI